MLFLLNNLAYELLSKNNNIDYAILTDDSKLDNIYINPLLEKITLVDDNRKNTQTRGHLKFISRNKYLFEVINNYNIYSHILYMRPDLHLKFAINDKLDSDKYIIPRQHNAPFFIYQDHCGFGKTNVVKKAWDYGDNILDVIRDYNRCPAKYTPEDILINLISKNGIELEHMLVDEYKLER